MNEMKKIKVTAIPKGELIKRLNNKQLINFIVPFTIGLLMLFGGWQLKVFGLIFVVYTIFVFIRFKDKIVVDVYQEFLVVYDREDSTLATIIRWDEIETWDLKISQSHEDSLFVENKDNEIINITMFGIGRLAVYFRKFVFKKNKNEKYKKEQNAKGSSFSIGKAFKSFKKED